MEVPANGVGAARTVDAVVKVLLACEAGVAGATEAVKAVYDWNTTGRVNVFPVIQSAGMIVKRVFWNSVTALLHLHLFITLSTLLSVRNPSSGLLFFIAHSTHTLWNTQVQKRERAYLIFYSHVTNVPLSSLGIWKSLSV